MAYSKIVLITIFHYDQASFNLSKNYIMFVTLGEGRIHLPVKISKELESW